MKKFLKENKWKLLIILVVGLFSYSIKLCNYVVSIDTEVFINSPQEVIEQWISIGRWGLVGIKNIFHLIPINIYIANISAFIIFFISIVIWFLVFDKLSKNEIAKLIFGLIIITSPILAEQFYFSLQSVEIAIALLILSIAFYFQEKWIYDDKKWAIIPTILCITFSFGCYQAFIPLYIAMCVCIYCLEEIDNKRILKYLLIFFSAIILNLIIDKIVKNVYNIKSTNYLTKQIEWGVLPIKLCIMRCLKSIYYTLFAKGIQEPLCYSFAFVLIMLVIKDKKVKNKKLLFFTFICLFLVVPFLTDFIKGTREVTRARFAIVFIVGFALYYILVNTDNKIILNITKTVAVYTIIFQTVITFGLFNQDLKRYREDVKIANKLNEDLKDYDISKPILIVGKKEASNSKLKGELLGNTSFFSHDYFLMQGCTRRALGFMKTLGMKEYKMVSVKQATDTREEIKEIKMEKYPKEGYILELDKYIIINF